MKFHHHMVAIKQAIKRHLERKTLHIKVYIPEHADRTETPLYRESRKKLFSISPRFIFKAEPGKCFICQKTEKELGAPLQSHHFGIERCFAEAAGIDWSLVKQDFPDFDWDNFDPLNPYSFVDDMSAQGLLLCEEHHIGEDSGIHATTFSLWIMQRYLKSGYRYSPSEIIS